VIRWVGAVGWAAANLVIGMCAIVPLGLGVTLAVFVARGPYPEGTNHVSTTPFEVDGDEVGVAALLVIFGLLALAGLIAAVNVPLRRRLPAPLARLAWPCGAALIALPFAVFCATTLV
jgi:hypothetical protein